MLTYKPGTMLRFTYLGTNTVDKFKEVFVLNPNYEGNCHALDLKRLNMAERVVLKTIMDPRNKNIEHKMPIVNDIFRRMDPINDIKNPYSFYHRFVKSFIRGQDVYRKYKFQKMSAIQIMTQMRSFYLGQEKGQETQQATGAANTKPVFGEKNQNKVFGESNPNKVFGPKK